MYDPKHQRYKDSLEDTCKKELLDLITDKSFGSCLIVTPFLFNHKGAVNVERNIDQHLH
jgi:hypothetical protein